jgi:hypothetical protein
MAAAAWLVTTGAGWAFGGDGIVPMAKALYASLTVGLVWQFVLVAFSSGASRDAALVDGSGRLWLRSPRSPRSGRSAAALADPDPADRAVRRAHELVPTIARPENRDFADPRRVGRR